MMTPAQAREIQSALKAKGHPIGTSGPNRDGVDGDYGPTTHKAALAALGASPAVSAASPAPATPPPTGVALTAAQRAKLAGVHKDLVRVLEQAAAMGANFRVLQGLRTVAEQKKLVASGASQTMNSRHLTGHAVDIYPLDDVDRDSAAWDWDDFYPLAEQIRAAADRVGVPIRWGGCWAVLNGTKKSAKALVAEYTASRKAAGRKAFLDGPHFELPSAQYP